MIIHPRFLTASASRGRRFEWPPALLSVMLLVSINVSAQSLMPGDVDGLLDEARSGDVLASDMQNAPVDRARGASSDAVARPLEPFGAKLFRGGFSGDREDGLNPNYVIQSGDRLSVRIWGAVDYSEVVTVDPRGNIFIPRVGPVAVAGVRNSDLNGRVTSAVRTVYTDNVKVYTSLNGSQPVAVFVTGFVESPGRFSGIPSNSALHFIDRAGGIDPERGSYRRIRVQRNGATLADIDLYDFLLEGEMPSIQFKDGDTIVVSARGDVVSVVGEVANPGLFELPGKALNGERIMRLAMLSPGVTHVGVSGIRGQKRYADYLPVDEFLDTPLANGDSLTFRSDSQDEVIVVEIDGAFIGPSRYAVPRDTHLMDLLDHVEVNPDVADVEAVSLKRVAVAKRQREAIEASLARLESRYLLASSQTDAEARIRSQEAELIREFVQRARAVEPSGRLVVARNRSVADIQLQQGDVISIPRFSDSVLLSGEVLINQALLHERGLRARDYIRRAGGFTDQALERRLLVMHPNGAVTTGKNPAIAPGDEIVVLPKVPSKHLQLSSVIVDILYKVAIATRVAMDL